MLTSSSASELDALEGLSSAKAAVRQLFSSESAVHAVLIYGAEGAGKTTLAEILANAWLCLTPAESGPCGICKPCASFGRRQNADYQRLEPIGGSRILRQALFYFDGKGEPPPEGVIPVLGFFRTPPLLSARKVVLIEDADRMNSDATNVFLKTLEEPPPYARVILTTSAVGQVAPTIISRCMALACDLPPVEPNSDAERLLAGGSPGMLARIRANPSVHSRLADFASRLPAMKAEHALVASEELKEIAAALARADDDLGARAANAEALKLLAQALVSMEAPPAWTKSVIEAHRRVQGNANAGPTMDALFAGMLQS